MVLVLDGFARIAVLLVAMASAVGALTVLWRTPYIGGVIKWVWWRLAGEPLARFLRNLIGREVGEVVDARLSAIQARQIVTEQTVHRIEAQLLPNGGLSFHDTVTEAIAAANEAHQLVQTVLDARLREEDPG